MPFAFYRAQSAFSDPGDQLPRYAGLPSSPHQLARTARGLVLHRRENGLFEHDVPEQRLHHDAETRYLDDILRIVLDRDRAPLTRPRALGDRFIGVCRDFALLLCSFLRHTGTPARLRYGFADYLGPEGFHADHVAVEYWDDRRGWLLADAQMADPRVRDACAVDFDPVDVPRDRFLVAGAVWRAIRAGEADPAAFGVQPPGEGPLNGEEFVAGSVRLDLAMLNKVEPLLWDQWGPSDTGPLLGPIDQAALLTCGDVPFDAVRALFTGHEALRTPETVLSLAPFTGPRTVPLRPAATR